MKLDENSHTYCSGYNIFTPILFVYCVGITQLALCCFDFVIYNVVFSLASAAFLYKGMKYTHPRLITALTLFFLLT